MAHGRMVSNTLGRSKKFNRLPDHFTKLVYIHALTHADAEGRIEADPVNVYADDFVLDPDASIDRIETALKKLHEVGLIRLYEAKGKRCAAFADFHDHNTIYRHKSGDRKDLPLRESASRIPPPPDGTVTATAQGLHSDRTVTAPEVEVELEPELELEPEPEVEAESVEPAGDPNSSEAKFQRVMETGTSEHNETSRTRSTLKRLFGPFFATKNEESLQAWSRWSDKQLRTFMEASDPKLWPGEENKRREWILSDLLNELRSPPDPTTGNVDHLLRKYHHVEGTHEGNHFTVVGCTPDGKRLMTDIGTLTIQEVEEGSCHTTN